MSRKVLVGEFLHESGHQSYSEINRFAAMGDSVLLGPNLPSYVQAQPNYHLILELGPIIRMGVRAGVGEGLRFNKNNKWF